jgi:hypothetical protein
MFIISMFGCDFKSDTFVKVSDLPYEQLPKKVKNVYAIFDIEDSTSINYCLGDTLINFSNKLISIDYNLTTFTCSYIVKQDRVKLAELLGAVTPFFVYYNDVLYYPQVGSGGFYSKKTGTYIKVKKVLYGKVDFSPPSRVMKKHGKR